MGLSALPVWAGIPKENLIAHKGGLEVAPANTLAAFARAFKDGFTAECDVRKAPDGTLYLAHDVRKDWQKATRLEDVLKIMTDRDVLELDIKEKGIDVSSLLAKSKGTFLLPDGTIFSPSSESKSKSGERWLTVKWNDKKLTEEYFAAMSASNIAVNVWTIDDEKTAKRALERGAKWVTTNVPLAMSGLAQKGTHPDYAGDKDFVAQYRSAALDIAERKKVEVEVAGRRVARLSTGGGFNGFFVWDSAFCVLWALHAPERDLPIAGTLDTFYALQDEDGFICREYTKEGKPCWDKRHPWTYNPPILAWAEVEMFRAGRFDTNRLMRVYPHLVAFHQCYDRNLKRADGLYFGDIIGGGMDDVPRWPYGWEKEKDASGGIAATKEMIGEAVREKFWGWMGRKAWKHGWNRQAGWIDMSAQMAFDCLNLATIAEALGKADEAAAWRQEHARIRDLVNAKCWDEERGFYFDYTDEGGIIPRPTVAAFWTLLAKIPSAEQAARMVKTFDDPKLFGTVVPVTSMAPASKDYYAYGYWCGQSWPPTTYMTLRGLKAYGYDELAARLARTWYNSNAMLFDRDHTVYEHVASREMGKRDNGMRDFCGWGALTPVAIADEFGFLGGVGVGVGRGGLSESTSKCDRWLKGYYGKLPYAEYSVIDRAARCLEGNTGCNREGLEKTWHWLPIRAARPSTAGIFFGVWNWDCAFMALAMCKWDVELARDQFRVFRELQRADGMYPDVWKGDNRNADKRTSVQFSCTKPPVLAWAAWAAERAEHDGTFLREAYESLRRNMAWWDERRREKGAELFHYDGESTNRHWRQTYAGWESGMDNSPRWDGKPWQLYPVDLNCYMVMSYRVMRDFAGELGLRAERDEWAARERRLAAAIESTLWDDETKCYCDWDFVEGKFSRVLTPMAFLPLYIGIAPRDRAAAMAVQAKRLSPGWPSVSYDDKAFNPTGYWRGRTWINIAYFALKGLKWYGYDELAETGKATIMEWLMRNPSNFNENYNPKTGNPVGAMYFGWTNAFAIKFVLDWDDARSAEMPVGEEK